MAFYDLHVHISDSGGEDSVKDIIEMARRLGLSGVGIVLHAEQDFGILNAHKNEGDVDVVSVALVQAKSVNEMENLVSKCRDKAEIVAVFGGVYDINRAACENPMVDILFHPELGRIDSGLDHICCRSAAENDVAIEINIHQLLESYRKRRIRIFAKMRQNVMLSRKFGANIIVASGAMSKWDMRFGRELAAFPHLLGMELGESIASASDVPENIVKKNREKLAGNRWEGVKVHSDIQNLKEFVKDDDVI